MRRKGSYNALLKTAGIILFGGGVLTFLFSVFVLVTGRWKPDASLYEYQAVYRIFENISFIVPPAVGIIASALQLLAGYVSVKYSANLEIASGSIIIATLTIGGWLAYLVIVLLTRIRFVVISLPVPLIFGGGFSAGFMAVAQRMKRYFTPSSGVSDMWRDR